MNFCKKLLSRLPRPAESLDDRIYFAVVAIGIVSAAAAFLMGLIQGLRFSSELMTGLTGLWLAVMGLVSLRRPAVRQTCRVILVCGLNFVLLPLAYFASGGMTSGMVLFYLLGLFLVTALLRGRKRNVIFFVSLYYLLFSLHLGRAHPELIVPLSSREQYLDVKVTFFLTGLTLGTMTVGILNAYDAERQRNRELMEQLASLSVRDALTGLYNRRELFRRLDELFDPAEGKRGDCRVAMFDVDNFKRLNDTYGHQFGDTVLSAVAERLSGSVVPAEGELAARYGGEEFVCVLRSADAAEAFARVDAVRAEIAELKWEEAPGLRVSVSGGLVACGGYSAPKDAMHDADMLLYQAKAMGKNQIADRFIEHPAAG